MRTYTQNCGCVVLVADASATINYCAMHNSAKEAIEIIRVSVVQLDKLSTHPVVSASKEFLKKRFGG